MNVSMYEIVFYKNLEKFVDICNNYDSIKKCSIFFHDKEEKKPHYHLYIHLGTSRDIDYICKIFSIEKNYIENVKGRWSDCMLYGFHYNATDKYIYDNSCVVYEKNNCAFEIANKCYNKTDIKEKITSYANGEINYNSLKSLLSTEDFLKNFSLIENAKKLNKENSININRNIKVYTISGESGSGKTTLAKYLAESKGLSVYISSSGANFLDDYNGEDVLIIDDFRGSYMDFSDFLKLLDNNTASFIRARYHNIMPFFKYIIITSINAPTQYYSSYFLNGEPIKQLIRRISQSLFIASDGFAYSGIYDYNKKDYVIDFTRKIFDVEFIINQYKNKNKEIDDLF